MPFRFLPDPAIDPSISNIINSGDSVIIITGIKNLGETAIGPWIPMAYYKESVNDNNIIWKKDFNIQINPGETGYLTASIPEDMLSSFSTPIVNIIARVNDDGPWKNNADLYLIGGSYTKSFSCLDFRKDECDDTNNTFSMFNTRINEKMTKKATLLISPPVSNNGSYSNPVSVLYGEKIKYEINVINMIANADVKIIDTLPPYMDYVSSSAVPPTTTSLTVGIPPQNVLSWTLSGINLGDDSIVYFEATPASGSNESQPLYTNRAWIFIDNTLTFPTNSTYHQGAGSCVVTFSAGHGGSIYNTDPQVIDYSTSANEGVLVVPDEAHRFTGWSHDDYISHRGKLIKARSGIMYYDTLAIFGNVELRANFELNKYPIHYHLNGGINAESNPDLYTVESGPLTLEAPQKAGDVFVGWTGSNGEESQKTVTIPKGSTGELEYYANFLYSGRENSVQQEKPTDKIWSAGNEVYIRTSRTGSIVRIFTPDGILREQHTILSAGITKLKLDHGIYIITLNNGVGQKVFINLSNF
jgi:uncharacterized repeat protein (TIGR02543 family)/uncharacterized repeat protein (TIGR01451 family)